MADRILKFVMVYILISILFNVQNISAESNNRSNWVNNNDVEIGLRLGDRFFVQSVLVEIFGLNAKEITYKFIITPASSFGGPCDIYEQVRIGNNFDSFADKESICPGGKFAATLPMIGVPSALRQGYVNQTCEVLTSNQKMVAYTLSRIFEKNKIETPKNVTLVRAFQFFYPEKTPSGKVLEVLMEIGINQPSVENRWAKVLLALCIDPSWQVI